MKIQKKYQGAIPLNRIANEHNDSEVNTYSTQYLNNKLVCVSPYLPEDGEMVWIQTSNNLFPGWNVGRHYGSSNGVLTFDTDNSSTDLIPVDFTTNNKYTFSNLPGTSNIYISAFDSNRVYVGRTASGIKTEYTFYPDRLQSSGAGSGDANDIKYIAVTYQNIDVPDNTMLNLRSDVLPYEPYIDKKIYIKNDNGVYEEFCRVENKSAVLWENKAPTSAFEPQSIHLSSDDYDYLEFAFCPNTGNSEAYWFKVKKGDNITAQLITGGTSAVYIRNRICDRVSDTEYSLRDSRTFSALNAANSEVDNTRVIPICVIGYKY